VNDGTPVANHLRDLAFELKRAQDSMSQVEALTSRFPAFDLAAAYEVAHVIHGERVAEKARPIGRKIGFTNSALWPSFGVSQPVWAYVYDTTVIELRDAHATFSLRNLVEPKIEPEIIFKLHELPARGAGPVELLKSVEWVAHGFEIVQSHYPGWKLKAADAVADSGLHGALLIGPPRSVEQCGHEILAALKSFTLSVTCDDLHIATGTGSNVLGSPLDAVVHLLALLATQRSVAPLKAGEIITTGTITGAHSVQAGQIWRTHVAGIALPGLAVELIE